MSHVRRIILILVRCHRTSSNETDATLENNGSPRLGIHLHVARKSRFFGTDALTICLDILLDIQPVETGVTIFLFWHHID